MYRFLLILCFAMSGQAIAQPKQEIYRLSIVTIDGKVKAGYLRSLSDSTVTLAAKPNALAPQQVISYSEIDVIKIRKHRAILKGWLVGTAGGATMGAIIGRATYEEPDCTGFLCIDLGPGLQTLGGGIIGGLAGGILGITVGSQSKKIKVSGNKKVFMDAQAELKNLILE